MLPSARQLVARFLKTNGYVQTLDAFITEAGLPPDAGSVTPRDDHISIEKILQEKQAFDLTLSFEKLGVDDGPKGWTSAAPSLSSIIDVLPSSSNILNVTGEILSLDNDGSHQHVMCSSADRRLNLMKVTGPHTVALRKSFPHAHDSPILSWVSIDNRYLLTGSMSGRLTLFDLRDENPIEQRQDHTKYVVQIAVLRTASGFIIATAGWDGKINVYHQDHDSIKTGVGEPIATLKLPSIPESITFVEHPDTARPVLLLTRRDSTFLFYYWTPEVLESESVSVKRSLDLLGKQNLTPHSNAWVAFTPSNIAVCPTDPSIVAVATSREPHMKLLIVRLLVPPVHQDDAAGEAETILQAHAALALQNREAAAILVSCNTMASQTSYSTPILAWRPNGSGVWVNSDDGVIRGIDATSGKVVSHLRGHTPGSRIRCLWTGYVDSPMDNATQEEWLLSGGFDQKLILWYPEKA